MFPSTLKDLAARSRACLASRLLKRHTNASIEDAREFLLKGSVPFRPLETQAVRAARPHAPHEWTGVLPVAL